MKLLFTLVGLSLLASVTAHAQAPATGTMSMPMKPSSPTAMPLVNGEVKKVDKARGEVVLKHGDLPNLGMPAMTMAFSADKTMLDKLNVGDKVRFNAEMVKGKATVTLMEAAR